MASLVNLISLVAKHLPGQHDQQKHRGAVFTTPSLLHSETFNVTPDDHSGIDENVHVYTNSQEQQLLGLVDTVEALDDIADESGTDTIDHKYVHVRGKPALALGDIYVTVDMDEGRKSWTVNRTKGYAYTIEHGIPEPVLQPAIRVYNPADAAKAAYAAAYVFSSNIHKKRLLAGSHDKTIREFARNFAKDTKDYAYEHPVETAMTVAGIATATLAGAANIKAALAQRTLWRANKVMTSQNELKEMMNHPALEGEEHNDWRDKVKAHTDMVDKMIATKGVRRRDLAPLYKPMTKLLKEGQKRQQEVFNSLA